MYSIKISCYSDNLYLVFDVNDKKKPIDVPKGFFILSGIFLQRESGIIS